MRGAEMTSPSPWCCAPKAHLSRQQRFELWRRRWLAIGVGVVIWMIAIAAWPFRGLKDQFTMQLPARVATGRAAGPGNMRTGRHNSVDIRTKSVKLAPTAAFRAMGDEGVILMTDSGQIYSTNPSGTAFIRQITVGRSVADAVNAVLDEFDVGEDVLLADLEELVTFLEAEGVVVTTGS